MVPQIWNFLKKENPVQYNWSNINHNYWMGEEEETTAERKQLIMVPVPSPSSDSQQQKANTVSEDRWKNIIPLSAQRRKISFLQIQSIDAEPLLIRAAVKCFKCGCNTETSWWHTLLKKSSQNCSKMQPCPAEALQAGPGAAGDTAGTAQQSRVWSFGSLDLGGHSITGTGEPAWQSFTKAHSNPPSYRKGICL